MKIEKPYLKHILHECEFLMEKSNKLDFKEFINDPVLTRAFVRSLEIIGEATKKLSDEFKKKYSFIPWKEIAGMRDKLIHEYFGVNYKIVWKTIQEEIPQLKIQILEIINKENWE